MALTEQEIEAVWHRFQVECPLDEYWGNDHNRILEYACRAGYALAQQHQAERVGRLAAADVLAAAVDQAVRRGSINSRSLIADCRLDYGEPFAPEESAKLLSKRRHTEIPAADHPPDEPKAWQASAIARRLSENPKILTDIEKRLASENPEDWGDRQRAEQGFEDALRDAWNARGECDAAQQINEFRRYLNGVLKASQADVDTSPEFYRGRLAAVRLIKHEFDRRFGAER